MYQKEAAEKLKKEAEKGPFGRKAEAMKKTILVALVDFCGQDEEFAQAVVQGGSFADCMKAVENGVGNAISDLDAIKKAVGFYFRGADVTFKMQIDVCPNRVRRDDVEEKTAILIDLEDFL